MNIYRFPDHYEVTDGNTLYIVTYALTAIRKLGKVGEGYRSSGTLVSHPMKQLLFPIINLINKNRRSELANDTISGLADENTSANSPINKSSNQ